MTAARAARLLFQLPSESRIVRQIHPINNWDWTHILLNRIGYWVEVLAWQKTKDGQKKTPQNAPKLYKPPFMLSEAEREAANSENELHTTAEVKAILARPRTEQEITEVAPLTPDHSPAPPQNITPPLSNKNQGDTKGGKGSKQ